MNYDFAEGYVEKCLCSLKRCATQFIYESYNANLHDKHTLQEKEPETEETDNDKDDVFFTEFFREAEISTPRMNKEAVKFKFDTELDREINDYTLIISSSTFCNEKKNLLEFWSSNSSKLPILCSLSRILLNISSSSAFIERFFSISGIICKQ